MGKNELLKGQLIKYCTQFVENQIEHVQTAINLAKESAQNESKSSAGDKHETGKSLMQLEQENNAQHLNNMLNQKRIITLIQQRESNTEIGLGSLIETSKGYYFIAIGIGKVDMENATVFIISPTAPVGRAFQKKEVGNEVTFNGNRVEILNIL
jgi:transcription elongation GreA/GreB family factor